MSKWNERVSELSDMNEINKMRMSQWMREEYEVGEMSM